ACIVLTWVPLLLFTLAGGTALTGVEVPFLADIDVHIRFLLALPLMIGAELLVHQRLRVAVGNFISRGIIGPEVRARFDEIVASTMRLRNSVAIEVAILAGAITLGYWIWRSAMSLHVETWYLKVGSAGEE